MIDRPGPSEAAPFYSRYIDLVRGDAGQVLETQLAEFTALFDSISEEKSEHRYAEGKWSIRELLSHVTDTERAFAFRALSFGRGFTDPLPGFDPNIAAAGAQADRLPWSEHVEDFRRVRLATLSLFGQMPPEAWDRGGTASGKHVTVRAVAYIAAGHAAHHVNILRERYL